MVALVDVLFGVLALGGGLLVAAGVYAFWLSDQLGSTSFAVFLCLIGLSAVGSGLFGLTLTPVSPDEGATWTAFGIYGWLVATVPWVFFALQYTGTYTEIQLRTVALVSLPVVATLFNLGVALVSENTSLTQVVATIFSVYAIGLVIVGIYLLVQTTAQYGHLSVTQGLVTSAIPVLALFSFNVVTFYSDPVGPRAVTHSVVGVWVGLGATAVTLFRYDLLDSTPAIGTIGERAIARETDDLVFVVNDCGRIIKINETATETLGIDQGAVLGGQLTTLFEYDTDNLAGRETVTLETDDGVRRYDPQVSSLTDQHGNELGALLSLRDVTERELREQRLAVLNRVLRHNLRNKIEVIRSHAEVLDGYAVNGHSDTIIEAADSLVDLGQSARTIDRFVSESSDDATVNLTAAVDECLAAVDSPDSGVTVSVDTPESAVLSTNARALSAALESAVENAVAYADSEVQVTVTEREGNYAIEISDDGPGIPAGELQSIDAGVETALQHGTGIGLWQLKWAVRSMSGELSFETEGGTTVEIVLPKCVTEQED